MFGRKTKRIRELEQRERSLLEEIRELRDNTNSLTLTLGHFWQKVERLEERLKPRIRSNFRKIAK